jgi:hypothetical protein
VRRILNTFLTYHRRAAEEGIRLRSQVMRKLRDDEEGLVIMQTGAEVLMEQGRKIGIEVGKKIGVEEGKKIGVEEAMRSVAGDLLKQKFGALPERAERRLLTMDLAGMQALTLAVSSANSLDDLGL